MALQPIVCISLAIKLQQGSSLSAETWMRECIQGHFCPVHHLQSAGLLDQ